MSVEIALPGHGDQRTASALAGIVAARICHDLVSPVGAIANGCDLIAEIGAEEAGEEIDLVRRSALRAAAILRLQRLAFGTLSDPAAPVARSEIVAQLRAVHGSRRVEIEVEGEDGPPLSSAEARLLALLAMSARRMLGLAGTLGVGIAPEGLPFAIFADGPGAALPDHVAGWLAGDLWVLPDAREVEIALAYPAAVAAGARLRWGASPGRVTLDALRL